MFLFRKSNVRIIIIIHPLVYTFCCCQWLKSWNMRQQLETNRGATFDDFRYPLISGWVIVKFRKFKNKNAVVVIQCDIAWWLKPTKQDLLLSRSLKDPGWLMLGQVQPDKENILGMLNSLRSTAPWFWMTNYFKLNYTFLNYVQP